MNKVIGYQRPGVSLAPKHSPGAKIVFVAPKLLHCRTHRAIPRVKNGPKCRFGVIIFPLASPSFKEVGSV